MAVKAAWQGGARFHEAEWWPKRELLVAIGVDVVVFQAFGASFK